MFNATEYGATCPQAISGTSYTQQDEDCLNLNIWAPASTPHKSRSTQPDYRRSKAPAITSRGHNGPKGNPPAEPGRRDTGLPVFVYMYGGAMVTGSSSNPQFQGNNFARKGVIFVSFNTRESIYAYPNSAELAGTEESQNFGILDVDKALEWVHDNIAGEYL